MLGKRPGGLVVAKAWKAGDRASGSSKFGGGIVYRANV
jgi:hypothetical protein